MYALNQNTVLSVKGAWETVQHSACGELSDELRDKVCGQLRALATGRPMPGGEQLPLSDAALQQLFLKQRQALKEEWTHRAVGDELVRREYWQELEEAMDMEEESSRDRNTRIADEHLAEVCREWLAWLDDDNGTLSAGRKVSEDMVHMMQRTPVAPLCRAVAMAVEAASHRLAKDRAQLATMREQTHDYQEQLLACNSHASQLESSLRSELEAKVAELDNLNEQLKHLQRSHQDTHDWVNFALAFVVLRIVRSYLAGHLACVRSVVSFNGAVWFAAGDSGHLHFDASTEKVS